MTNEGRWFKFWSDDQKPNNYAPNIYDVCKKCYGEPTISNDDNSKIEGFCEECDGVGFYYHNPLLEEYADVIHFTLSIANDIDYTNHEYIKTQPRDLNDLVIGITNAITVLSASPNHDLMQSIFNNIIALGYQLGFTEDEVIAAYHDKNKVNHSRQDNNY